MILVIILTPKLFVALSLTQKVLILKLPKGTPQKLIEGTIREIRGLEIPKLHREYTAYDEEASYPWEWRAMTQHLFTEPSHVHCLMREVM